MDLDRLLMYLGFSGFNKSQQPCVISNADLGCGHDQNALFPLLKSEFCCLVVVSDTL